MKLADANRDLKVALENLGRSRRKFAEALSKTPITFNRKAALDCLENSPRLFIAYCAMVRLLKSEQTFFANESFVLVVQIPRTWALEDFEYVSEICFAGLNNKPNLVLNIFTHPPRGKKGNWDFQPQKQLCYRKVLIFAHSGVELHPEIVAAADQIADLPLSDIHHFAGVSRVFATGPLSDDDVSFLGRHAAPYIDTVFRRGRPAAPAMQRVRAVVTKTRGVRPPLPITSFGEAGAWGLSLKADLEAWRKGVLNWSEIDKGILLYGPPGVGKTSFAKSLAVECDVHLVASSLGKWQSHGHLGDLLKAMYADFAEAKDKAPALLLIDEFDAFGDRAKLRGDNAQYVLEVINAALEAIDGTSQREGVVIIGATNLPHRIDSAFLRAGRLEKHVLIAKPNNGTRAAILEYYLPEIAGDPLLLDVARRLPGRTGADLEYVARRARQKARQNGRGLTISDVLDEAPPETSLSSDEDWRVCLHEAGHAILASLADVGDIEYVAVFGLNSYAEDSNDTLGRTMIVHPAPAIRTENFFRDDICVSLAGLAAEELLLGDRSTTGGGVERSDLARATEAAVEMITKFGMGRSLQVLPPGLDETDGLSRLHYLRPEIDRILKAEFRRSKAVLEANRQVLVDLAKALQLERKVEGERLDELLAPLARNDLASVIGSRASGL
jgi:cell division protease FtsH